MRREIEELTKDRDLARKMLLEDKTHEACATFQEKQRKEIEKLKEERDAYRTMVMRKWKMLLMEGKWK